MKEKMIEEKEEMPGEMPEEKLEKISGESEESDDNEIDIDYNEKYDKEKENFSKMIEISKKDIINPQDINKKNKRFKIKEQDNKYSLIPDENGECYLIEENENSYFFMDNCKDIFEDKNSRYSKKTNNKPSDDDIEIPENVIVVSNNCISNICRKISICCTNCLTSLKNCLCNSK